MILRCPNCRRVMDTDRDVRIGNVLGCRICLPDVEPPEEDLQPGKAEPIWPEEFER